MLVLGTLPGEESLRRQQYYAHPRNLFWPIIFALFGASVPESYDERVRFVRDRGIALWDVVESGMRTASADATIRAEIPNAIPELTALFLPLAAWLIASRRGDWDQLLAATLVTVGIAVPALLLSVSLEVYLFPELIRLTQ